jgi:Uma2 family endonuclease
MAQSKDKWARSAKSDGGTLVCMNLVLDQLEMTARIELGKPMSVEEFWRYSAEYPDLRMELEPNGDLIVMTPTTTKTGFRNSEISFALRSWAEQDGRGYAFDSSTGFTLPDGSVRSPDAAWIGKDRWNPEDDEEEDCLEVLCPDFIIELRSKSDRLPAAQRKMAAWIANGVKLAWLIDPRRKIVEIYRAGEGQVQMVENPAAVEGEDPVRGFVLELERIWGKG